MVKADIPKYRWRWVILGAAWVTYAVSTMNRLNLSPVAPLIMNDLRFTHTQIGLFMTALYVGSVITIIPIGAVVDKAGLRHSTAFGLSVSGLFTLIFIRMNTFIEGFFYRLLIGVGGSFILIASSKAIIVWFSGKERATAMGIKQTGLNAGIVLSALLTSYLAIAHGWRMVFVITGLLGIVFAIVSEFLLKEPSRIAESTNPRAIKATLSNASTKMKLKASLNREITLLCLATVVIGAVELAGLTFLPIFLIDKYGFSVIVANILLIVTNVTGAIGKPLFGLISDYFLGGKRKLVIAICFIGTSISCVLFGVTAPDVSVWVVGFFCALWGFMAIGWAGLWLTLLGEFGGEEASGVAISFGEFFATLGFLLGPMIFGYIVDITGSYAFAWYTFAIMLFAAVPFLLLLREERRKL